MSEPFKSELKTGAERYLAKVMVSALNDGWRKPEDFLRHFKPGDMMQRLEKAPDLRAAILVKAAGVHERIAKKKSTGSATDDRVRYLERAKLWNFITEEHFWEPNASAPAGQAVARMTFLIESALAESLL